MSGLRSWEGVKGDCIHVLSLGGGRQSSVMLLMTLAGEISPAPDAVIFADTGDEPSWVYSQIEYLKAQCKDKIPFYTVSNGNIKEDSNRALSGEHIWGERRWVGQPVFAPAPVRRKCTRHYKIKPSEDLKRELIKDNSKKYIVNWRGHTINELQRAKPDKRKKHFNRWPLLELRLYDHDLVNWLHENNHPQFKWSACVRCPFVTSDKKRVIDLLPYKNDLIEFDEKIRNMEQFGIKNPCFMNRKGLTMAQQFDIAINESLNSDNYPLFEGFDLFGCDSGECGL